MPLFEYKAVNKKGKQVADVLDAADANAAVHQVRALGLFPLHVAEAGKPKGRTQAEADAVAAYLNDAAESDSKIPCWLDRGVYYLVPVPTYYETLFKFFAIGAIVGVTIAVIGCMAFLSSMGKQ